MVLNLLALQQNQFPLGAPYHVLHVYGLLVVSQKTDFPVNISDGFYLNNCLRSNEVKLSKLSKRILLPPLNDNENSFSQWKLAKKTQTETSVKKKKTSLFLLEMLQEKHQWLKESDPGLYVRSTQSRFKGLNSTVIWENKWIRYKFPSIVFVK